MTVDARVHEKLDIRFADDKVSILVETKQNFDVELEKNKKQLQTYVEFEKIETGNEIIAILANTTDRRIKVWKGEVNDECFLAEETDLRSFREYEELFFGKTNDKEKVIRSTYQLNEKLHSLGINAKIRSQFVGTCLLALKCGLSGYDKKEGTDKGWSTATILSTIKGCLEKMLDRDFSRAEKLTLLNNRVLENQRVKELNNEEFIDILNIIKNEILEYINDSSAAGQDILSLFFTTFNKYVGKDDKNQAFTPDHIVQFMSKIAGVTRESRVLDPCCGSGAFLVRALTDAVNDCNGNEEMKNKVKREHIYGIENDSITFGLATTNMLIHGDGNSNVINRNCFTVKDWIEKANIDIVLMNPPYNAQRVLCNPDCVKNWDDKQKEDPTKGFHFVEYIADIVRKGKLLALLPMSCAIGSKGEIKACKHRMLEKHHLDAVFSLPSDVFHPGASTCACCMVFELGVRHNNARIKETFFGYYKDDGFVKKKNYGRIERAPGEWDKIQKKWLDAYLYRRDIAGFSVNAQVSADDEWLAEAYMETDHSTLSDRDFEKVIRNFLAFQIATGKNLKK